MAESRTCRFDIGWEFRLIEGLFSWWVVLFRNDVIDGLFHLLLFFIMLVENTTDQASSYKANINILLTSRLTIDSLVINLVLIFILVV